jgi:hypothetical protein
MKYEIHNINCDETQVCTAVLYRNFLCSLWAKESGEYGIKFFAILSEATAPVSKKMKFLPQRF